MIILANPQIENGYTPIANELLEAFYQRSFTAAEFKIILFVMRYTYGFSRKEHELSLNYISKGIGVSKRYVSSALKKLIEDNILLVVKEHGDTASRVMKINKNFEQWKSRAIVQQMKYSSTVEAENNTTDELQFNTTDELEFYQDKQILKQYNKTSKQRLQKHKYGEYKHVLLSDEEKIKLISECGQDMFDKCITKLDEYIEMKGYKAKNHYLCIRKWVIKAVQEDEAKSKKKGDEQSETYDTGSWTTDYYKQFKAAK